MQRWKTLHPNRYDARGDTDSYAGAYTHTASTHTHANIDARGDTDSYAGAYTHTASTHTHANIDARGDTSANPWSDTDALCVCNRNPA